jgi:hypothetical protein
MLCEHVIAGITNSIPSEAVSKHVVTAVTRVLQSNVSLTNLPTVDAATGELGING